jgi:hypothetical protein
MRIPKLIILAAGAASLLGADTVTYTSSASGGKVAYEFTLANSGSMGGTVFDLFLHIPTDVGNIDTPMIGTPVGWGDPTGGLLFFGSDTDPSTSFIEWSADFSGTYDVRIGSSLAGFSFTATEDVGTPITFALNGSATFAEAQNVSTPEPGSFVALLAFFAAIGHRLRRSFPTEYRIK